jgi:hypothetical protein
VVDSAGRRSYHPGMPMWRCPHCGTPQAETARCWVCQRSTTNCGTCRHFRRSVAAQLGYCGLDRKRQPLDGNEIRGCWEAWPAGEARTDVALTIGPARSSDGQHRHLEFIEVGAALEEAEDDGAVPAAMPSREPGWSLWGDADR